MLDFNKGEQKSAEHVKLNPNGRIPTLVDNETGSAIWEVSFLIDIFSRA